MPKLGAVVERTFLLSGPLSLGQTLGPLVQGRHDPCAQWRGARLWRAVRTSDGPATTLMEVLSGNRLRVRGWGPGALNAVTAAPRVVGEPADSGKLATTKGYDGAFGHDVLDDLRHRHPGLRVPRTLDICDALVFTTLAQRVTGGEAVRAWRGIVNTWGETAPVPSIEAPRLMLAPTPSRLADVPSWAMHRFGVERKRAETIRAIGRCARRLEETAHLSLDEARRRLAAIPGVGPWTVAEVGLVALGDTDAVSVGDYHLNNHVSWALAGEHRGDDARMLELLEPYRGRRGLAVRLITVGHPRPPKYGPRYAPLPIASL